MSREVRGCPQGVTFPQGWGRRRPEAACASSFPGGPWRELRCDLTCGFPTAFMLQNFCPNEIVSMRYINWSFGLKGSECGRGGGPGHWDS